MRKFTISEASKEADVFVELLWNKILTHEIDAQLFYSFMEQIREHENIAGRLTQQKYNKQD